MQAYKFEHLSEFKNSKGSLKIENKKLIFDEDTKQLEFVDLGQYLGKDVEYSPFDGLFDAEITEVEFFTEQPNLRYLDLSYCKLKTITIKNCPKLQTLYLFNCELEEIVFEGKFEKLHLIDLSKNKLVSVNLDYNSFPNLGNLFLSGNPIKDISFIAPFVLNNDEFDYGIEECEEIQTPPAEFIKQGKEAVLRWFTANKKALKEIKVILIGNAQAGKTSLLRRLKNNEFKENEVQTDGIIIEKFDFSELETFKTQKNIHDIIAYFWDFGGQEIMSSTHQFFLTKRSVYLLVLEARNDEKTEEQVKNWLKHINTFGGNSQVIVVVNKIEVNKAFDFNKYELKNKYPQIKDFVNISCFENTGITELKDKLAEYIPQAELFNTEMDEKWFPVKEELQKLTADEQYLTQKEFEKICIDNKIDNPESQKDLITFLNDLGVVLHFSDLRKSDYFVLDPLWVTNGIYKIITSDFAAEKKGEINLSDLDYIVNKEVPKKNAYKATQNKKIRYSANEQIYLSEIMAEFKLSYFSDNRDKILIPDLLGKQPPVEELEKFENLPDKLNLIYKYEYLPLSVIHSFMVSIKKDIKKAWRTGVLLKSSGNINANALVMSIENKVIISVSAEHTQKSDYLSIIRYFLDELNSKHNFKAELEIPLNGFRGKSVKYKRVISMDKAGEKIFRDWDEDGKEYKISVLLSGIIEKEKIQNQAQTINNMYIVGDGNKVLQNVEGRDISLYGKSEEEIKNLLYQQFKESLDGLHSRHDKHDRNFEALNTNISEFFKDQTSEIREIVEKSFLIMENELKTSTFEIISEINEFKIKNREGYAVLEDLIEALPREEDKKIIDDIVEDNTITVKQKLSISIPFFIGKYSASIDLKELKITKTKKGLKDYFKNFKEKHFSKK